MIISKITSNNIAYYYLHAEAAYMNGDVNGVEICIDTPYLSKTVIDNITKDILNDRKSSTFVLDFEGIESIQANPIVEVIPRLKTYCIENKKNIRLDHISPGIINLIKNTTVGRDLRREFASVFMVSEANGKINDSNNVFITTLTDKLKKYMKENHEPHHSSSVYLPKYIDIKDFITSDKPFFLYSIYNLAKQIQVKEEWKNKFKSEDKPTLICQSLNGSFIASLLSSLLGLDLFIFDSIGPINKLYRSLGATIQPGKEYIVASDVVCMGTEVRITKNIIEYLGGKYCGNVSIVRVASTRDYPDAVSVFEIDNGNKDEFGYEIITPLEKKQ